MPQSHAAGEAGIEDRPDGSVERLRADIDRGRTGDKVDWPDPAAAPLGTNEEAGGNPTNAAPGRSEHRDETLKSSLPRRNRDGIGAAWIIIAAAVIFAAIVIGSYFLL